MVRASLIVVVMLMARVVYAQAPGEVGSQPPAPGVMTKRWAIGAALGSESLTAKVDGAPHVGFGVVELAGRFRIRRDLEVALSFVGGGAMKGELTTGGLYVDARYRFRAEQPWNVFALAGLGVVSVARKDGSDVEKKGRGSLHLGGGVERRFGAFALAAELKLVAIGKHAAVPPVEPPTLSYEMARYAVSGASLTLGATYYF